MPSDLLGVLQKHVETKDGVTTFATLFGVTEKTVDNWSKGTRVERRLFPKLVDALEKIAQRRSGQGAAEAAMVQDPTEDIRRLFDEGRRLHYGCFHTEAAMDVLQTLERHPGLQAVRPAEMLKMFAVTLSIYRQSVDATDWHFHRCGRRCLTLLLRVNLQHHGDELAAAICTVAWELIAVTVQRGWALEGVPLLKRVNEILDERDLWQHLEVGRERSLRRLMHWGRVIAYENVDEAGTYVRKHGSPIDKLPAKAVHSAVEIPNVASQKMWELLRFSIAGKDKNKATDYFDTRIRAVLKDLESQSRHLTVPTNQANPIRQFFTPSTAVAMAFQCIMASLYLPLQDASYIVQCSTHIIRRIRDASDGAIMLQKINLETQKLFEENKAAGKMHPEILELFPFVNDISQRGKIKLHAQALQLLDCAESCSRRI